MENKKNELFNEYLFINEYGELSIVGELVLVGFAIGCICYFLKVAKDILKKEGK